MDFKELQQKENAELMKLLSEKRALLRELRFKILEGQMKNVKASRTIRKEIAQIETILTSQNQKS
jgi:ribosomal protein L29